MNLKDIIEGDLGAWFIGVVTLLNSKFFVNELSLFVCLVQALAEVIILKVCASIRTGVLPVRIIVVINSFEILEIDIVNVGVSFFILIFLVVAFESSFVVAVI